MLILFVAMWGSKLDRDVAKDVPDRWGAIAECVPGHNPKNPNTTKHLCYILKDFMPITPQSDVFVLDIYAMMCLYTCD